MIEGFRIEVTADELISHLERRIETQRELADQCERRRIRAEAVGDGAAMPVADDPDDPDAQLACWPAFGDELARRAARHRRREASLQFLRDHVVAHEIYRLDEQDLRWLDLWPAPARAEW